MPGAVGQILVVCTLGGGEPRGVGHPETLLRGPLRLG